MIYEIWVVSVKDYSDYVPQTIIDSVWLSEAKALSRESELKKEFSKDRFCDYYPQVDRWEVSD